MKIWRIHPDPDRYRSVSPLEMTPSETVDLKSRFGAGTPIGAMWQPIRVSLFQYEGEDRKPMGDFPSFGGVVPLIISKMALDALLPLIGADVEPLDLTTDFGPYLALNVFARDCLDLSKTEFKRFKSGRIRGVEHYVFRNDHLEGHHIFRLPQEIMSRIFADTSFKEAVESHGLQGLHFDEIP